MLATYGKWTAKRSYSDFITSKSIKMEIRLFDLSVGDMFVLSGRTYTVKRFFNKRRPRIGTALHCEAFDSDGNARLFLNNWKVFRLDNPE